MDSDDGRLLVRCYSQDGEEHRDFHFSPLSMAPGLKDALLAAFVKRTAPGAGLTSLGSMEKSHRALVLFDRYLASLSWPPREASHLTPEHFEGFYDSRSHIGSASTELSELKCTLVRVEGISDALAGRLAGPLPRRPQGEAKQSYSRSELKRIADAARTDLRAAARRIRDNRELLRRSREGELDPGDDRLLAERLELLDWVDRFADVPRMTRTGGKTAGMVETPRWVKKFGTAQKIVSWLHLTTAEVAAGAVLLAVMTGENPDVIYKVPAAHHRADGYTGAAGTAIVALQKPRRGRRAHMDLALSEVPDWISVPETPDEVAARDELHTPFGLYVLLHDLTARSRAMIGGNRLLIGYSATGGGSIGRGLRPLSDNGLPVSRLGQSWGLTADTTDQRGELAPLHVRLDLLRLTYIELHQKPVAHTEKTAATTYLARNRGNVAEYQKVVASTLTSEVNKARARGAMATMSAQDVERARTEPVVVAAEQGVEPATLQRMIAGELDTVLAACSDHTGGPHAPPGEPCRASFMQCLDCECARALPRHLPLQVLVHDRLAERRDQMDALPWAQRFAGPHAQLADLLDQHDEAAVHDARRAATAADHTLIERFLRRELDLR
ncbi:MULTISPECIES: hypothetical protein [unclassified Streptomyces]|uniref:hypothetical protein n=1 Tax=unclassified Streptomyces TaxID=2593676 RepID=UPI001BE5794B|nr:MULTISPECIES: hypothetical protein [unclassified Streptomyces]MBT2405865.1 hypothetical protein [Streptomyces sp. ISL-21]MBT2613030.1 hypothetical protein [Streptomyces sp. ISL-87]